MKNSQTLQACLFFKQAKLISDNNNIKNMYMLQMASLTTELL